MSGTDLRIAPRLKTFIAAKASFNSGLSTLDCVIRNMSDTGAKLSFPAPCTSRIVST